MALLDICKRVLAETGWPVPNAIATNSDATAQQIFAIACTELRALSEMFNWPHLEVEYAFPTIAAQSVYLWPTDFRVLAADSIFNADQYYGLKGSTSLPFWELLKYGHLGNLNTQRFRVTYPLGAPAIQITPTPVGVQSLIAVYYSKNYARAADGTDLPCYMQDADVSKIPERYVELGVKWRFRRAKGLDYSAELSEYNSTIQTQFARYIAQGELPIGGRRHLDGLTPGYVRTEGFGS